MRPGSFFRSSKKRGIIFVISGPSGSGKSTLLDEILKDPGVKKILSRSVSLTTRPKRSGESSGTHYFFVTDARFEKLLEAKKILEWTRYLGYYYGTPKDFFKKQRHQLKHIALCLDYKGALQVKKLYPENTITVFVMPPSLRLLAARIKKRCSKTKDDEIKKRLEMARKEISYCKKYDHCLVNKDLRQAVKKLKSIILEEITQHQEV